MYNDLERKIKNILSEELYKNLSVIEEARHLNNHRIIRNSDNMVGKIVRSRVHGNAYDIEWEDGTTQTLGRKTITNKKNYELKKPRQKVKKDEEIVEEGKFGTIYDPERQKRIKRRLEKREEDQRAYENSIASIDDPDVREVNESEGNEESSNGGMLNLSLVDKLKDPMLDDDLKEFNETYENNVDLLREECKKLYARMGGNGKIKVNYNKSKPDLYVITIYDKNFDENKLQKMINKLEGKHEIYDYNIINSNDLLIANIIMEIEINKSISESMNTNYDYEDNTIAHIISDLYKLEPEVSDEKGKNGLEDVYDIHYLYKDDELKQMSIATLLDDEKFVKKLKKEIFDNGLENRFYGYFNN